MSKELSSATSKAFPTAMILEIDQPVEDFPLQFPVVIRDLLGEVATLEVINPPTIMDWESLKGQEGCLRLLAETGEVANVQGLVNWARYSVPGLDRGILNLGLALTDPDPSLRKRLTECIQHPAKDLKGFWDRWDQAQESKSPLLSSSKIGLLALTLLLSALFLQIAGAVQFLPRLLWYGGIGVVAYQLLRFWQELKDH